MQDKYDITDAELEIMQVLWENKRCDLNTIIENINKELESTIIMATHDKEIVNRMKKRVICIDNGVIISDKEKGSYVENEDN